MKDKLANGLICQSEKSKFVNCSKLCKHYSPKAGEYFDCKKLKKELSYCQSHFANCKHFKEA